MYGHQESGDRVSLESVSVHDKRTRQRMGSQTVNADKVTDMCDVGKKVNKNSEG